MLSGSCGEEHYHVCVCVCMAMCVCVCVSVCLCLCLCIGLCVCVTKLAWVAVVAIVSLLLMLSGSCGEDHPFCVYAYICVVSRHMPLCVSLSVPVYMYGPVCLCVSE